MCDVVAVSTDLFRSVFVGVFGPSGRDRRYECCVNTLTHLWNGANADTVDEGTLEDLAFLQTQHSEIKMEAEEKARQLQKITRKFEQLFLILSNSLQHLTKIIIPQIIKSLSQSQAANTCLCSVPGLLLKNYLQFTVGVLIPSPKPPHPSCNTSQQEWRKDRNTLICAPGAYFLF